MPVNPYEDPTASSNYRATWSEVLEDNGDLVIDINVYEAGPRGGCGAPYPLPPIFWQQLLQALASTCDVNEMLDNPEGETK